MKKQDNLLESSLSFAYQKQLKVSLFTSASNKLDGVIYAYDDGNVLLIRYPEQGEPEDLIKSTVIDRYHVVSISFHPKDVHTFLAWIDTETNEYKPEE